MRQMLLVALFSSSATYNKSCVVPCLVVVVSLILCCFFVYSCYPYLIVWHIVLRCSYQGFCGMIWCSSLICEMICVCFCLLATLAYDWPLCTRLDSVTVLDAVLRHSDSDVLYLHDSSDPKPAVVSCLCRELCFCVFQFITIIIIFCLHYISFYKHINYCFLFCFFIFYFPLLFNFFMFLKYVSYAH